MNQETNLPRLISAQRTPALRHSALPLFKTPTYAASGQPGLDESLPVCSIPMWQGNLSRVDRDDAIIEIGDFPVYGTNSVGHSARFKRISNDTLEITVRGVFFYYGPIPNDEVARGLVTVIKDHL